VHRAHDCKASRYYRQWLKRLKHVPLPASGTLKIADPLLPVALVYVKDKAAHAIRPAHSVPTLTWYPLGPVALCDFTLPNLAVLSEEAIWCYLNVLQA
jgi:hypothetical protein